MLMTRRFAAVMSLSMLFAATWPGGRSLRGESLATVSGAVFDSNGRPLSGARVTLSGEGVSPTSVLTVGGGRFRFPVVDPDHVYSISAQLSGFRTIMYDGIVPEAGRTRSVRFRLSHPGDREIVALVSRDPFPYEEFLRGFSIRLGGDVRVVDLDREPDPLEAVRRTRAERPDLILGAGLRTARLVRSEIRDIPSLLTLITDPRRYDLQTTTTCFLINQPDADRLIRRLTAVLPQARRLGMVYDAEVSSLLARDLRQAAERKGLWLEFRPCHSPSELPRALDSLKGQIDALVVPDDDLTTSARVRERITTWALRNRVALAAPSPEWVDRGALFSYGASFERQGEEASRIAELLLRGVLQPSQFRILRSSELERAINQKTAQTLGLTLLAQGSTDYGD